MVFIAFQDDVKNAFSKVKDDILNLKRAVNREVLAVEAVGGKLQTLVAKEEFYSFIKRLGERLEKMEANLENSSAYEDGIKEVESKIINLGKKLSRQENLSAEIKEIKGLSAKLKGLEGSTVKVHVFNDEIGRLLEGISSVKKGMLTGKSFESAKSGIDSINKKLESLEQSIPSKESVSDNLEAIKSLRQSLENIEVESRKKLESVSRGLEREVEAVRGSSVSNEVFDKKSGEIKKELNSLKNLLDSSVSEIDLSDYATKKEFGKKIAEVKLEVGKLANSILKAEGGLGDVRKNAASLEDIDRIGSDVKSISKSVDSLKAVIEKVSEVVQERLDKKLVQVNERFEKELAKLKADFDGKIVKVGKEGKAGKPGLVSRVQKGVIDFFKEDDELPKKEEKSKKFDVSELLKGEEKKTGRGKFLLISGVVVMVLVLSLFFYFSLGTEKEVPTKESGENLTGGFVKGGVTTAEVVEVGGGKAPVMAENEVSGESAPVEVVKDKVAKAVSEEPKETGVVAVKEKVAEEIKNGASSAEETCRDTYECKKTPQGDYWFDCHVDEEGKCRCFVTDAERCSIVREEASAAEEGTSGGFGNNSLYLISAAVVLLVLVGFYIVSSKNGKQKGVNKKKNHDEEGVDLDEFFQKK